MKQNLKKYSIKMIVKEIPSDNKPDTIYILVSKEIYDIYKIETIDAQNGLCKLVKRKGVKK